MNKSHGMSMKPQTIEIDGKKYDRRKFREEMMKATGCNCDFCVEVLKYKIAVKRLIINNLGKPQVKSVE